MWNRRTYTQPYLVFVLIKFIKFETGGQNWYQLQQNE